MNVLFEIIKQRCEGLLVSQAVEACAEVMEDACTPRPPKAEWFGIGPGQWDSWWVELHLTGKEAHPDKHLHLLRCVRYVPAGAHGCAYLSGRRFTEWHTIANALPVARTGYPAPVGWQVVERGGK